MGEGYRRYRRKLSDSQKDFEQISTFAGSRAESLKYAWNRPQVSWPRFGSTKHSTPVPSLSFSLNIQDLGKGVSAPAHLVHFPLLDLFEFLADMTTYSGLVWNFSYKS